MFFGPILKMYCQYAFSICIVRDEGHTDGGECYVTFTACNVNLGNGFIPKSGVFSVSSFSRFDSFNRRKTVFLLHYFHYWGIKLTLIAVSWARPLHVHLDCVHLRWQEVSPHPQKERKGHLRSYRSGVLQNVKSFTRNQILAHKLRQFWYF